MEAIRSYIHNIETEIAVLEMKEQIINYMAKIVALDAMQLAEKVSEINVNDVDTNTRYKRPNKRNQYFYKVLRKENK